MEIVLKKNENKKSNIINILYPVSNTLLFKLEDLQMDLILKKIL